MSRRVLFILLGVIAFILILGAAALAGGAVTYFALQARPVKAALAEQAVTGEEGGLLIAAVHPDSLADQAGLVRGDILTEVNGEEINNARDLSTVLANAQAGETLELAVLHGDDLRSLTVELPEGEDFGLLGIRSCGPLPLEEGLLRRFRFDGTGIRGALISEVVPDSPADQAGLRVHEVILSVDDIELEAETDLTELIHSYEPGDIVSLEVKRLGEDAGREVQVTLGEDPDQEGQAYLGVRYTSLPHIQPSEGDRRPFPFFPFAPDLRDLPEGVELAVVVAEVAPDSPAEKAGLQKGDLITAINGKTSGEPQELVETIRSLEPGDQITLTVYHQDEEQATEIAVSLGEDPDKPGQPYLGARIGGYLRLQRNR